MTKSTRRRTIAYRRGSFAGTVACNLAGPSRMFIAIAIIGKFGGTCIAARTMNLPVRQSSALGALMNTRGLTELIVFNIALDEEVISRALFTALVVMAHRSWSRRRPRRRSSRCSRSRPPSPAGSRPVN